jgi:hypothetical protein
VRIAPKMIDYSNKQHFFWLSTGTEQIKHFINNWLAQILVHLVHFKKNYSFHQEGAGPNYQPYRK